MDGSVSDSNNKEISFSLYRQGDEVFLNYTILGQKTPNQIPLRDTNLDITLKNVSSAVSDITTLLSPNEPLFCSTYLQSFVPHALEELRELVALGYKIQNEEILRKVYDTVLNKEF